MFVVLKQTNNLKIKTMLIVKGEFHNNRGHRVGITQRQPYLTFFSDGTSVVSKTIKELEDKAANSKTFRAVSLIKYRLKFGF